MLTSMVTAHGPWFLWGASGLGSHGALFAIKAGRGGWCSGHPFPWESPSQAPALASHRLNCAPHTQTAVPGRLPRESCPWPCGEGGGWLRPVGGGSEPLCCVAQTCDLPPEGGDPALELEVSERQPSNTGWELELREAVRVFTFAPPVSELAVSPEGLCLTCPGSRLLCSSLHPLPGFLSCSLGNSQRLLPGSSGLHPPSLSTI